MTRTLKLRRKQMRMRHQDGWVELRGRDGLNCGVGRLSGGTVTFTSMNATNTARRSGTIAGSIWATKQRCVREKLRTN